MFTISLYTTFLWPMIIQRVNQIYFRPTYTDTSLPSHCTVYSVYSDMSVHTRAYIVHTMYSDKSSNVVSWRIKVSIYSFGNNIWSICHLCKIIYIKYCVKYVICLLYDIYIYCMFAYVIKASYILNEYIRIYILYI